MFDGSYRSGDIRHSKASIGKLTGATDWRPSVTIAEAINSYCAFIRAHWDEFRTPVDSTSIETGKLKERGLL
jgi:nucleoside-diphosphate-sugar epimerase